MYIGQRNERNEAHGHGLHFDGNGGFFGLYENNNEITGYNFCTIEEYDEIRDRLTFDSNVRPVMNPKPNEIPKYPTGFYDTDFVLPIHCERQLKKLNLLLKGIIL